MRHDDQVRHVKDLLARLDAGVNVDAGGLRRNPTWVYVDPELAERERREIFGNNPQMIGLSGDLPEPGSFFTMDDLQLPIIATRDADGQFHALVNACRHRGARIEDRDRGTTRRFSCPFHAWTYDSSGTLVGLPKPDHFGEVDVACLGLTELPAVEAHGLLFVHPDPAGSIDPAELLGPELEAELASWHLDELQLLSTDSYDTACNWKLAMDTFGETYHFPTLHRDTLNFAFHGNVQCYDTFGRHHRMLLCRRDIDTMRHLPEAEWDITVAALPVYWLFPSVQLMPFHEGLYLVRAYPHPTDPGRHMSRITFYLRPGAAANAESSDLQLMIAETFAQIIRDEDYVMSASQQRSAETGALTEMVFGRNEPALHHYHNTYRSVLGMEPLPLLSEDDAVGAP